MSKTERGREHVGGSGVRTMAALLVLSALASATIFTVAASQYPGGTHFDHLSKGHDFWRNTLCDVARSTALGGASNAVGATLARTAMTIMAVAIGVLFWLVPAHFPSRPGLGRLVRSLGGLSVPAAVGVAFLPTDRFSALHGVVIVVAGVPGLVAATLAFFGLAREHARPQWAVTILGGLTLVAAILDFGVYVHELLVGGPPRVAVAILERVAAILLVAWILAVARACWTAEHRSFGARGGR